MKLIRISTFRELSLLRGIGQAHQFLLQVLHNGAHIVYGLLHLFVIALIGVCDQLVDLTVRNLGENAVTFADGQQNRIQHGVDAAYDVGVGAAELVGLAALGELPVLRGLGEAHQLLLEALHDRAHSVDRLFHLFVIALIGLGDELVDLAVGDLGQDAVTLGDGQQDRIQHLVDALHHLPMSTLELVDFATLVETPVARGLHQAQDLLRYPAQLELLPARAGASRTPWSGTAVPPLPEFRGCFLLYTLRAIDSVFLFDELGR